MHVDVPSSSFVQGVAGEAGPSGPSGPRVSIDEVFSSSAVTLLLSSGLELNMDVSDVSPLSIRATEVSLVSAVLLVLLAQLDPVVLMDPLVTMDLRLVSCS